MKGPEPSPEQEMDQEQETAVGQVQVQRGRQVDGQADKEAVSVVRDRAEQGSPQLFLPHTNNQGIGWRVVMPLQCVCV